MSATETGLTALERNWAMVDRALEDLDDGIISGPAQRGLQLYRVASLAHEQGG